MSKLRSRLERRGIRKGERRDPPGDEQQAPQWDSSERPSPELLDELRRRMDRVSRRHAPGRPGPSRAAAPDPSRHGSELPGRDVLNSHGSLRVDVRRYPADHLCGEEPLAGYLDAGNSLTVLGRDPRLRGLDPRGARFFDTETTGLCGGTGTLPFLVGVGRFTGDGGFEVEQALARDPSEEPAQLEWLAERLAGAGYLVTFNGRAFDVPLINTRFVINRQRNPAAALPHLDLLHVSRRVFGRRLSDRSLQSIERAVLGFEREGDIPGAEIPGVYAEFVRGGPAAPIAAVMEHNALDLLALAALGGALDRMYGDPEAVRHAADHLGLATAALAAGLDERADAHLRRAGDAATGDDRRAALHLAAREAARRKERGRARDLWLELVERDPGDAVAHLALAKHYEHRERDWERAAHHASRAVEAEGDEAVEHRLARIERKAAR